MVGPETRDGGVAHLGSDDVQLELIRAVTMPRDPSNGRQSRPETSDPHPEAPFSTSTTSTAGRFVARSFNFSAGFKHPVWQAELGLTSF